MMQRHIPENLNLQQRYNGNLKCGRHLDIPGYNTRASGMYYAVGGFNTVDMYSVHTSASLIITINIFYAFSRSCRNGQ